MKPAIVQVIFTVSARIPMDDEESVMDLGLVEATEEIISNELGRISDDFIVESWDNVQVTDYGDFAKEPLECPGCETESVLAEEVAYIRKHGMCHACRRKAKIEQLKNILHALNPDSNWLLLPLDSMADLSLSLEDEGKSLTL
jgi:hypothetical protein